MNRLYRSETDKMIAGVCGGLGEYLRLDPLIIRIFFVVLAITLNGTALLIYLLLWVLVPTRSALGQGQSQPTQPLAPEDQRAANNRLVIIGAALALLGLIILLDNLGLLIWLDAGRLWPLLLIAVGSLVVLNNLKDKR